MIATSLLIAAAFAAQSPAPGVNVSDPERDVKSTFEMRGRAADACAALLPILRGLQQAGVTTDALRATIARIPGRDSSGFDPAQNQVLRRNIELLLAGRMKVTQEQAVQQWIDRLEAEGAAYDAHRRAKASRRVARRPG